ncbi:inner membrane transporter yedA [Salmonella bongori]|nr:inner membrane transporter yedA [Salmonella bongori]
MRFRQLLPLFGALFALYIIWGSTYFVIRIGVESWPPLMMAGVRFLSAGILLMAFLLLRGEKLPPLRQTVNAALIGLLLLAVGNGLGHGGGTSKRPLGHCRSGGCHRPVVYAVLQLLFLALKPAN